MRLYRFVKTDDKIDVVVATDGSCGQKRVFITESPRGVVVPGQTGATDDQKEGSDSFLALGWKWNVGETVQHEDLVESATRFGEITNGGHSIKGKILNSWTFTLADLGLDAKEELEIVLFANGGVQSFNLVASAD